MTLQSTTSSIPLQKLLRLLGVDSLPIEANPEGAGYTCWYQGRTWQVELEESQEFRKERATLRLTAAEITLADLAPLLDLNERFAGVYGWLTLQSVTIYGTASQYGDRESLTIKAEVIEDPEHSPLSQALTQGSLTGLHFRASIRHRPGTYRKAYTVALLADFAVTNTTLQVGIALPVGQTGIWTLALHQGGAGLSWDSLKQIFVPIGQDATALDPLHKHVNTFTFHLNTLLIRFDPADAHPLYHIELDVSATSGDSWNLLGDTAPHMALTEIGLRLQVDHRGRGDFAYQGAVRGALQIGGVSLRAEIPLPWTGSFTLQAQQTTEETFHLDAFTALAEGEAALSDHLPTGLKDFALQLRNLEVVVEQYAIQSFTLSIASTEGAGAWEIWKDHLALDSFDFSLALRQTNGTWQSSGSLKAAARLEGVAVAAKLEKDPEGVWDLSITDPVHFGTLAKVQTLIGLDLSDESATDQLPALQSREGVTEPFGVVLRQFRMRTTAGTFGLQSCSLYLETEGQLSLTNDVVLDRAAVVLHAEKTNGSLHVNRAQIGGTLRVEGHPLRLVSAKNSSGSDWTFSGKSQPGDAIPVLGLANQAGLEAEAPQDLTVQDISLQYTPHTAALSFSAVANLTYSDKLSGRFQIDLDHQGGESAHTTVTALARIRIAEAIFRITGSYDKAWSFSGAMEGTLTLSDVLEAFFEEPGETQDLPLVNPSVSDLQFAIDRATHQYTFSGTAGVSVALPKGEPLMGTVTARLDRSGEKKPWEWDLSGTLDLPLGHTTLSLTAHAASAQAGWQLTGEANVSSGNPLSVGELITDITQYVGEPHDPPHILQGIDITTLSAALDTGAKTYTFTGGLQFPLLNGTVALDTQIVYQGKKADTPAEFTLTGALKLGADHTFRVQFDQAKEVLVGTYQGGAGSEVSLSNLVGSLFDISIPDTLTLQLHDALLVYQKGNKAFLMSHLGAGLDLSNLPLIGRLFPKQNDATIQYQLSVATDAFTSEEIAAIRPLIGGIVLEAKALDAGLGVAVQMPFADTEVELPLAVNTEATAEAPGPLRLQAEKAATTDPAVKWYALQKRIGPIHFSRIGVKYQEGALTFLLDAGLVAAGFSIELEGLSVSTPLTEFKPSFGLSGLALDFKRSVVEIGGALQRVAGSDADDSPEYDGTVLFKVGRFSVGAMGSYTEHDGHPSLFIFGATHAPLGGPPFFFVTGLSAGFGYNRALTVPPVADVLQFPLVQEAMGSTGADTPGAEAMMEALQGIKPYLSPAEGEYWLAAGLSFTSFKLLDGTLLLVASFGKAFELDVLGVATLSLPPVSAQPFAEVQMALKGAFKPEEGFLGLSGQLTPASHIFAKAAKLTGGFAYHSWFAGEHADDFVTTLGGYHPHFAKPEHYPSVPRVGLHWQVDPHTLIKGESYFALCPQGIMAGGAFQLAYHKDALKAHFLLAADFLMTWKPFHYEGKFQAHLTVDYTYHFWGTHHLSLDLGAEVSLWGPDFGGEAALDLFVTTITVGFGADKPEKPDTIVWSEFQTSFLPDSPKPVALAQATPLEVGGGTHLGTFHPHELSFEINTPVPVKELNGEAMATAPIGVVPMGLEAAAFDSTLEVTVRRMGGKDELMTLASQPIAKKVPAALWNNGAAPGLEAQGLLAAVMGATVVVGLPVDDTPSREADDFNTIRTNVSVKNLWGNPLEELKTPRTPTKRPQGITATGKGLLDELGLKLDLDISETAMPQVETLVM